MTPIDEGVSKRRYSASPQTRLVLTAVLCCVLVAAIAVGTWQAVSYARADNTVSGQQVDNSLAQQLRTRASIKLAVASFVANMNSYSVSNIGAYRNRLRPMLTPGFAQSFDLAVKNIVSEVKATKMSSTGDVLSTAISSMDAHSATALVVADAHVTSALGDRIRHFRWRVTLVKGNGRWLVDDFAPVQ
ncbi:MAG: hypothetical protein ACRDPG_12600 [Nocardioidaceae bacterium]